MAEDAIGKRFGDEIELRGYDDKYIDKNEEREILQIAIHQGIGVDVARTTLAAVCARQDYILESELVRSVKEHFETTAANRGKIDQASFDAIANQIRTAIRGRRNEQELAKLMVMVIEDHGFKVRTGWLFGWYSAVKRRAGMA
jgi:hypothetical protein